MSRARDSLLQFYLGTLLPTPRLSTVEDWLALLYNSLQKQKLYFTRFTTSTVYGTVDSTITCQTQAGEKRRSTE